MTDENIPSISQTPRLSCQCLKKIPLFGLGLSAGDLRELEVHIATGKTAVNLGVGVESVVNTDALLLVKKDLEQLAAVLLGADTLADDLDREAQIGQDGVVDGGQGAGTGALLLLGVAGASRSLGARQNTARGEDQDVAVRELLLELTGQAAAG